jgi:hypothetical protein
MDMIKREYHIQRIKQLEELIEGRHNDIISMSKEIRTHEESLVINK